MSLGVHVCSSCELTRSPTRCPSAYPAQEAGRRPCFPACEFSCERACVRRLPMRRERLDSAGRKCIPSGKAAFALRAPPRPRLGIPPCPVRVISTYIEREKRSRIIRRGSPLFSLLPLTQPFRVIPVTARLSQCRPTSTTLGGSRRASAVHSVVPHRWKSERGESHLGCGSSEIACSTTLYGKKCAYRIASWCETTVETTHIIISVRTSSICSDFLF